jgi:hypothetical protein
MGQGHAGVQAAAWFSFNAATGMRGRKPRLRQSAFAAQLQLSTAAKFAVDRAAAGYNM